MAGIALCVAVCSFEHQRVSRCAPRPSCAMASMAPEVPAFSPDEHPLKRCKTEDDLDGASGAKVLTKSEKAAFRAKFYRSLESKGQRPSRTEKCPSQLALRLRDDPQGLGRWFGLFCECEGDWAKFEVSFQQLDSQRRAKEGHKEWLDEARLLALFKSPIVVASMIAHARSEGNERPSPNAPTDPNANEYLVVTKDSETSIVVQEKSRRVRGVMEVSGAAASGLASHFGGADAPVAASPVCLPAPAPFAPALPSPPSQVPHSCNEQLPVPPSVAPCAAVGTSSIVDKKVAEFQHKQLEKQRAAEIRAATRKAAAQAKAEARKDARAELKKKQDAQKQLPTSMALKWSAGLAKDIGRALELKEAIAEMPLKESIKTEFIKTFSEWELRLRTLRRSMETVATTEDAESFLVSGPGIVAEFHSAIKNFNRVKAMPNMTAH